MAKKKKTFWKWLINLLSKIKVGGTRKAEDDGGPVNPPPKP